MTWKLEITLQNGETNWWRFDDEPTGSRSVDAFYVEYTGTFTKRDEQGEMVEQAPARPVRVRIYEGNVAAIYVGEEAANDGA
jgi:hypothetical protein